jgi:hypothetical protein
MFRSDRSGWLCSLSWCNCLTVFITRLLVLHFSSHRETFFTRLSLNVIFCWFKIAWHLITWVKGIGKSFCYYSVLQTICSGSFDIQIRSYRSNLVLSSLMVSKCTKSLCISLSTFNIGCLKISYAWYWWWKNLRYRARDDSINFV